MIGFELLSIAVLTGVIFADRHPQERFSPVALIALLSLSLAVARNAATAEPWLSMSPHMLIALAVGAGVAFAAHSPSRGTEPTHTRVGTAAHGPGQHRPAPPPGARS